jgi:hypothetical protein
VKRNQDQLNDNPEVISALSHAGANAKLESTEGKTACNYGEENPNLKETREYLELKNATH